MDWDKFDFPERDTTNLLRERHVKALTNFIAGRSDKFYWGVFASNDGPDMVTEYFDSVNQKINNCPPSLYKKYYF